MNVKAAAVEYKGHKAVRLTKDVEKDGKRLITMTMVSSEVVPQN